MSKTHKYIRKAGESPRGIQNGWREVEPQTLTTRDIVRKNWHFLPRSRRSRGSLNVRIVEDGGQQTFFGNSEFLA